MIAVLQRVNKASVEVEGKTISEIGKVILIFLGIDKKDSEAVQLLSVIPRGPHDPEESLTPVSPESLK